MSIYDKTGLHDPQIETAFELWMAAQPDWIDVKAIECATAFVGGWGAGKNNTVSDEIDIISVSAKICAAKKVYNQIVDNANACLDKREADCNAVLAEANRIRVVAITAAEDVHNEAITERCRVISEIYSERDAIVDAASLNYKQVCKANQGTPCEVPK